MTQAQTEFDERPTAEMIVERANKGFADHGSRINALTHARDLMERNYKPFGNDRTPDEGTFRPYKPGTAGALVHRIAAQAMADQPVVVYPPRNNTQKAQAEADLAEQWGMSVLQSIERSGTAPPLMMAAKWGVIGMWCLKGPLFNFKAWNAMPRRSEFSSGSDYRDAMQRHKIHQADNPPFIVESIDPRKIIWDETNPLNPGWVIEKLEIPRYRAQSLFKTFENPEAKGSSSNVKVLSYWSRYWRMILADGQIVTWIPGENGEDGVRGPIRNIYGYVPHQLGFGPWSWADGSAAEMGRGLLYYVEDDILEESRIASLMSWQAQLYGLTPLVGKDAEKIREELAAGPGAILEAEGDDISKTAPRPMQMPEPPPWLEAYQSAVAARIQQNTVSPALQGFRVPGTTSGVMQGVEIGEGGKVLKPMVQRLQQQAANILNRAAFIHEQLVEESMSTWLDRSNGRQIVTLEPDVWRGTFHFQVDLEPVDPTRDDRRGMLGLNYYAQGLMDPWTVLEDFLRHPNANQVIARLMKWKVMQSPQYLEMLASVGAEEAGFQDILNELEQMGLAPGEGGQRTVGDFEPVDGPALNPGVPEQQRELDFPTRNQPATGPALLSPGGGALNGSIAEGAARRGG